MSLFELVNVTILAGFFTAVVFMFSGGLRQEFRIFRENRRYAKIYHSVPAHSNLRDLLLNLFIVLFAGYYAVLTLIILAFVIYQNLKP